MTQLIPAAVSAVTANVGAAVVSFQTQDASASVIVGWISITILGICSTVAFLAPYVAKAFVTAAQAIIPAYGEVKKQLEEISKGTYTGQIEELKEMVTDLKGDLGDARERESRLEASLDKARRSLHEIRDKQSEDILSRDVKIQELEGEIKSLRLEVLRLTNLLADRSDAQDRKIQDNADSISRILEAGQSAIDDIREAS